MTGIKEHLKKPTATRPGWYGTVSKAPTDFDDQMNVVVPNFDHTLHWEDVRWSARDNRTLPVLGDEVFLTMDDFAQPWAVAWWPSVRGPRMFDSLYSSPPVSPHDGDTWIAHNVSSTIKRMEFQWDQVAAAWLPVTSRPSAYTTNPSGSDQDIAWGGGPSSIVYDRMTPVSSCSLRAYGRPPAGPGSQVTIRNYGAGGVLITIKMLAAGSPANNGAKFFMRGSAPTDAILEPGDSITFTYTDDDDIWIETSRDGAFDHWHLFGAAGEPAYQNGWFNYATGNWTLGGFRKFGDWGMLKGLLRNTASVPAQNIIIATMPVGYRPGENHLFHLDAESFGYARVDIGPTGDILFGRAANLTVSDTSIVGSGGYLSLSGVVWPIP